MNKEEIEALVEMKDNCLNASVYDDEKRLIKANAITRALMLLEENNELKKEIRKYQKDRDINTKKHLEVQGYIKSRIRYCKEMTGFDCCIEELEEISKMV